MALWTFDYQIVQKHLSIKDFIFVNAVLLLF